MLPQSLRAQRGPLPAMGAGASAEGGGAAAAAAPAVGEDDAVYAMMHAENRVVAETLEQVRLP